MATEPSAKPLRLLSTVPNKVYDRLIVRYPFQTDRDYALAYQYAATRLADTFTGRPSDDLMLLPFLTLYRHAFELELKNTIKALVGIRMNYVDGRTAQLEAAVAETRFKDDFGHNLYKLLNEAKKHYDALDMPEPFPRSVEELIIMMHEADRAGTAFRYSGELPEVQEHADFPDLAELLGDQFTLLSVVEDYVEGRYSAGPTLEDVSSHF